MLGFYPNPIIKFFWKFTAPLVTAILFVFSLIMYHPLKYPNGNNYPLWAEIFGFILSGCSMIAIPIYALFYIFWKPKNVSLKERFYSGIHPPKSFDDNQLMSNHEEEMQLLIKICKYG